MAQARRVRRNPHPGRSTRPIPGWIWLLAGVVAGLAVAGTLYLQGADRMARDFGGLGIAQPSSPSTTAEPATRPVPDAAAPERSRFQFYELLPRDQVTIPRAPAPPPASPPPRATAPATPPAASPPSPPAAAAATPAAPAAASGRVLLQTGSFREFAQADEMKARLAMMGLQANIRQVQVGGQSFHRVYIGPFENETQANRWAERLRRENMEVLRLPAPG